MSPLKVAVAQLNPSTFDMNSCVLKVCDYSEAAARKGAQLVVFGEMCVGGYPGWRPEIITFGDEEFFNGESKWISKKLFEISEPISGPSMEKLCRKAKELGIFLVTGFAEADPVIRGTIYNTAVVISSNGTIVGAHRKLHVGSLEQAYWKKGNISDVRVFPSALGTLGLAICYDVLFPEYTRMLDLMGEEIQCQLWATSKGYETASNCYPVARAMEGGVFVLSSCLTGKDKVTGIDYAGESQIVDPFGKVLARAAGDEEQLIFADVKSNLILDYRASGSFTLGMDRREDIYRLSLLDGRPMS